MPQVKERFKVGQYGHHRNYMQKVADWMPGEKAWKIHTEYKHKGYRTVANGSSDDIHYKPGDVVRVISSGNAYWFTVVEVERFDPSYCPFEDVAPLSDCETRQNDTGTNPARG